MKEEAEGVGVTEIGTEETEIRTELKGMEKKEKNEEIRSLLDRKFWEEANWIERVCEVLFHIKRRETTIEREIYCGFVQFISCLYILPVLPLQLEKAGYDLRSTYVVTVGEESKNEFVRKSNIF